MNLYELTIGSTRHIVAAKNKKHALEEGIKLDSTFEFLPVIIEKIEIPGYKITVTKSKDE